MMRSFWCLVAAVAIVAACTGDDGSTTAAPTAPTGVGSVMPAPPIPLDQRPTQFAAGDHYVVVHRDGGSVWREVAVYRFERERWKTLPAPPTLHTPTAAWDGRRLVLVGLQGCDAKEGIRCTRGEPTAARIDPDGGGWELIDLGLGTIDISPETGWRGWAIGGRDGAAYFEAEGRVLRITRDGQVVWGPPVAGRVCLAEPGLVAAPVAGMEAPVTPATAELSSLPLAFEDGTGWTAAPSARPPQVPDAHAEVRAVCGGDGVVLLDLVNGRALAWSPHGWTLQADLGDGPVQGHAATIGAEATASGDLVLQEQTADGHYVYRLRLGGTWRRVRADWTAISIVGDRVFGYPEQRADRAAEREWELVELDL